MSDQSQLPTETTSTRQVEPELEGNRANRAVLVGVDRSNGDSWSVEDSLAELAELIATAGSQTVGKVIQRRRNPDPRTYVGTGKVEEIQRIIEMQEADLVVADDELSPAQVRNLEKALNVRVIDRSQVILDIFAQRAQTNEGKLQVELAQLRYLLPRLTGRGAEMSRLAGGIGTRGPGETQLETDRRRIRERIASLRRRLERVRANRDLQRQLRQKSEKPIAALVGYTNAGKSTLLKALTGADTYIEDQLFATLDPTTRTLDPKYGASFFVVDTVGFINKLPHELIAAFRATLEEVVVADVLIHVIDASFPGWEAQAETVRTVLKDLGVDQYPMVTAFNKVDRLEGGAASLAGPLRRTPHSVAISALTGEGLDALVKKVEAVIPDPWITCDLVVPYTDGRTIDWLHRNGKVHAIEYSGDSVSMRVELPRSLAERVKSYRLT